MCEEPKTLFPYDECGWDYIDDTSGKLINNTLVEKARAEEISVIRELGVWKVVDRPRDEVVFGTRWVDFNRGDEHKPFYRSRLVAQECKRRADWSFFRATPPLEALRSLLIAQQFMSSRMKWENQLHGLSLWFLMLIDVRWALFLQRCSEEGVCRASCGGLYGQEQCWTVAEEHVWLPRRWSEFGNSRFCHVTIAIGFAQGGASPCIHRHLEKQLRVWVHGGDFVPLGCIVNVRCFVL